MAEVVIRIDSLAVAAIRTAFEDWARTSLAGDWDIWSQFVDEEAVILSAD